MHIKNSEVSSINTAEVLEDTDLSVQTATLDEAVKSLSLPGFDESLFCSNDWAKVIDATYQLPLNVMYIKKGDEVLSYIIYSVVKNFLEWKICVGSYCDYCDCHVQSEKHWQIFFKALVIEYPQYRIAIRNLHDEKARLCNSFQLLSQEMHHALDLSDDLQQLWKGTHKTFRSACARVKNANITIKPCDENGLRDFYRLHLRLRTRKYHIFPQPYSFFKNIWDQYIANNKGVLLGAYNAENQMVAASMFLICGKTLYYKFSTTDLNYTKSNPNKLMMWEGIKYAKDNGCEMMDLGSSGNEQEGLIWFKTHILKNVISSKINHLGYAPANYKYSNKRILGIYTKIFTQSWMPEAVVAFGSRFIYPFLA